MINGMAWLLVSFCMALAPPDRAGPNLAADASFEAETGGRAMPEAWRGDREVYALDRTVAHSGKVSLRYSNQRPGRYRLCTQKLALQPGAKYHFSVWVKTRDLAGPESGAQGTACCQNGSLGGSSKSMARRTISSERIGVPLQPRGFTVAIVPQSASLATIGPPRKGGIAVVLKAGVQPEGCPRRL